jgi:hypothetical protein
MSNGFKSGVNATPVTRKVTTPAANAARLAVGAKLDPIEIKAIICYPSLVEPDPQSGNKYNALLLVRDEESQQMLQDLVGDATEQTFRSRQLPPGAHNPLRQADERTPSGELAFKHPVFRVEGGMVVRVKSGYQPTCVAGRDQQPIAASEIRGGDEVVVEVTAYGYSNQSQGVGLSFNRVWRTRKGEIAVERGSGGGANVRRLDRSNLRFDDPVGDAEPEAA